MASPPLAPGMRQTRQRQLVWDAVATLGDHCTAEEILSLLRTTSPGVSRSTVYRALEALTASGALRAVYLGSGPVHYELLGEDHQHAICQVCQGVLHIEDDLLAQLRGHLEDRHRFRPVRLELLVVGVCDGCARGRRQPAGRRHLLEHIHYPKEG